MAAKDVPQQRQSDSVIDLAGDAQRLCDQGLRLIETTADQDREPEIEEHHLEGVEVADCTADSHALRCRGPDLVEVPLEEAVERSSLEERDGSGNIVKACRHRPRLSEETYGRGSIAGHVLRDRRQGESV